MIDVDREIKNTIKNGKVKIGAKETKQAISKGSAKLVILANNCPFAKDIKDLANKNKVPIYETNLTSIELGYKCGKSYAISVFAVIDDGGSNILNIVR